MAVQHHAHDHATRAVGRVRRDRITVGKFGIGSLLPLMKLVVCYYIAVALFMVLVLWSVLRWCGAGMFEFLRYIKEEIAIVFGTIASEAVMPRLIDKLEYLGCQAGCGADRPTNCLFIQPGRDRAISGFGTSFHCSGAQPGPLLE